MHTHTGILRPGGVFDNVEMCVHDIGGETVGEVFEESVEGDPVGESVIMDSSEDIEIPDLGAWRNSV